MFRLGLFLMWAGDRPQFFLTEHVQKFKNPNKKNVNRGYFSILKQDFIEG